MMNKRAMTLVEVLISLAIFTIMLQAIYSSLMIGQRSWVNYSQDIVPKQQLRHAMGIMVQELREATDMFIVRDDASIQLTFHKPMVGEVKYIWAVDGDDAYKIIRLQYGKKSTIGFGIASLAFLRPKDDEVIIEMAGSSPKITLKEKVALRLKTGLFGQSENEKI